MAAAYRTYSGYVKRSKMINSSRSLRNKFMYACSVGTGPAYRRKRVYRTNALGVYTNNNVIRNAERRDRNIDRRRWPSNLCRKVPRTKLKKSKATSSARLRFPEIEPPFRNPQN